jgi:hypothetical protein
LLGSPGRQPRTPRTEAWNSVIDGSAEPELEEDVQVALVGVVAEAAREFYLHHEFIPLETIRENSLLLWPRFA